MQKYLFVEKCKVFGCAWVHPVALIGQSPNNNLPALSCRRCAHDHGLPVPRKQTPGLTFEPKGTRNRQTINTIT